MVNILAGLGAVIQKDVIPTMVLADGGGDFFDGADQLVQQGIRDVGKV